MMPCWPSGCVCRISAQIECFRMLLSLGKMINYITIYDWLYLCIYIYISTSPSTAPIKSNQSNNYFITVLIRLQTNVWCIPRRQPLPTVIVWIEGCTAKRKSITLECSKAWVHVHTLESKTSSQWVEKRCEIVWDWLVHTGTRYCMVLLCRAVQPRSA